MKREESSASTRSVKTIGDPMTSSVTTTQAERYSETGFELESKQQTSAIEGDGRDYELKARLWRRRENITPWSEILNAPYKGSGTKEDPFTIDWLPDDAENPHRWKRGYKWFMTMMGAVGMLSITMSSSILSATINGIKNDFPGHHEMLYIMVTGIYILGMVVGPFIWAPVSEIVGRRPTCLWSFVPFTAFSAAICGAHTLDTLLILRFFQGVFGCSLMTNSGATISDMFEAHERGLAMGVFALMPFLGPVLGPIIGGNLGPATKWEWVAAFVAIFIFLVTMANMFLLAETFAPVLLRQRAVALTKATGKLHLSVGDVAKPLDTKALIKRQFQVPFKLLFTEPIVFFCCLYMATSFAILYLQFTAFPIVFQQHRHWSPGVGALAFIPVAIGTNLGLLFLGTVITPTYMRKHKERGYLPPEARLPPAMVGATLLPVGLMWFAWTCVPVSIHWIVPLLACIPYGSGVVLVFIAMQTYLVDAYLANAACVIAAGTVTRSVLGVVLPLFTVDMYNTLGVNWAGCLVAFMALIFTPVPFLLSAYGQRIRRWTKPGREADDMGLKIAAMAAKKRAEAALKVSDEAAAAGAIGAAEAEAEVANQEDLTAREEASKTVPSPSPKVDAGDMEMAVEGDGAHRKTAP